jgi:hypothetical protein
MARARFTARLRPSGRGGVGHLVEVPVEVVAALGGRGRIPVRASFNGVPYRGSIVRMGGVMMLRRDQGHHGRGGSRPGDLLDVVVENDEAARDIEVPQELSKALKRNRAAAAVWDGLSFSHRREYVGYIIEAKKEETRARRVEKTIQELAGRAGG